MRDYKIILNLYFGNVEDKELKYEVNLLDNNTLEIDATIKPN